MSNQQTDLFWELLANPADRSYSHVQNLRQLVNEYPQSSLLQSLLFSTGDDDRLGHATVYTDPRLLYKLRHDAGSLAQVNDNQLIKTGSEKSDLDNAEHNVAPEQEVHVPVSDNEPEPQPLVDEHQPTEHFFESQVSEAHTAETTEPEIIAEPENLDDLINYGDEVTTGEHELHPPVTEFHHQEHQEAEVPAAEESIPLPEHTLTSQEEEHPITVAPATEQDVELPTLGFYVPGAADTDENSYSGGDISTRLYETYAETFENAPQPVLHPIEDEVFDEIVGIDDINIASSAPFAAADEEGSQPELGFQVPSEASKEDPSTAKNRKVDLSDEAEKLMLSNIATTDFFVFDHALSERIKAGDEVKETPLSSAPAPEPVAQNAAPAVGQPADKKDEYERVTKYFDEKMPYSFMWWLDKTRKEHSGIYQPFVLDTTRNIEKNIPDELQQQYYENIFHLTSVEDLERATGNEPVVFDSRKKEDEIIERFIHEAPQIKPQTSEKLDNENKAKRSSEDQDEIVTETLAQIYTDQMLYHKAIRVYQKLILKFPEKSLYFASQIEQLEKKIS